jgi:hypothetical protein
MSSKFKLAMVGGAAYVAAVAIGYSYGNSKPQEEMNSLGPVDLSDEKRHSIYQTKAPKYDKGIAKSFIYDYIVIHI